MDRRSFLALGGVVAASSLGHGAARRWRRRVATGALVGAGRGPLRGPGTVPDPTRPVGTDGLAGLDHFVVLMLENHSYDNVLGMLGRGDGFRLGADGAPLATNPDGHGGTQRAFHMPTTCQLRGRPSQEWTASHEQFAGGRLDGFVTSASGPVSMGYWDRSDLPFTYSLAEEFCVGDRWFSSLLGQTEPNRRYLLAATSSGMTDDLPVGELEPSRRLPAARATLFTLLSSFGISWRNYVASFPDGATPELFPTLDSAIEATHHRRFEDFYADAADGRLPSVSLLDPDYTSQSEEDPQNLALGEALLARVVTALGCAPQWSSSVLLVVYDEHGGYYDHVPPPVALAPDGVAPVVRPGESTYDGFARYGFRVPAIVVSPYSRPAASTSVVHDHTSVLATIERKWNLPALTYRDANANDLTDFLDLGALGARRPVFPALPRLSAPGDTRAALACSTTGPGPIPPGAATTQPR